MMRNKRFLTDGIRGIVVAILAISNAPAANVVARPTTSTSTNRVSATRPTMAAARMPTMTANVNTTSSQSETTPTDTDTATTPVNTESNDTVTVENKSSLFGLDLASKTESQSDTAATTLAEMVRAQRAALDSADAAAAITAVSTTGTVGNGGNLCDTALRECMVQRCGTNFSKCAGDTDTTFGDKVDTCRRTTNCTGREYQLFASEIKADRDFYAKIANYNAIINCGNKYDECIVAQCGATYSKCVGKSAGDTAISKCESIAKSCTEQDSGLAMRTMGVFGELRQTAERQVSADEQKLYGLREQMRVLCTRLGAMFDERSLDCVYTVNFRAGDDNTLFASKKLYAGSTFDCTPNWFGIDVTTFRENALRASREQTSASSAMLGSGVGQAVGALTSGAIDRAIDRYTADKALDEAIQDCVENGVDENGNKMTEDDCRAKIGGDTSTKQKSDKKPTSLPADIESTLKQIQQNQDKESRDMPIEVPEIAIDNDELYTELDTDLASPEELKPKPVSEEKPVEQPIVDNTNAVDANQKVSKTKIQKASGSDDIELNINHLLQNPKEYLNRFFVPTISDELDEKVKSFVRQSMSKYPRTQLHSILVSQGNKVTIRTRHPELHAVNSGQKSTYSDYNDNFCKELNKQLGGQSGNWYIGSYSEIDYSDFGCQFIITQQAIDNK